VLESEFLLCSSFFLLKWRISDLVVAAHVVASPSGSVPGGGEGVHGWRSKFIGDDPGLDRVSTRFYGVLSVKI
jgi:hypothetical protein